MTRLLVGFGFLVLAFGFAQGQVWDEADRLESQGRFKEAAAVLTKALANPPSTPAERKQLEFDLDCLERIRKDFPFSKEDLFAELKKAVKDLTAEEFEQWVQEGRFDSREIDGRRCFMISSVSNLYFRYPELAPRRLPPKNTVALQKARVESCAAIRQAALAKKEPYVLPKRFNVTMTVTAKANAAPTGEIVRAWLPIPRRYPFQDYFELISTSPPLRSIAEPESSIRSVYLEEAAKANRPTEFKIEYDYTTYGVWFDLKPGMVSAEVQDPAAKRFTQEGPHVVFTPELRALSQQIVGDETNPCVKAKKCFDWIAENIKYSFAIEYSTIGNISDYCRSRGYGDCGQEAMLFIALCRLNGIPARWQTGWNTFPGDKDIHDWSEIYLAPYGWVPVDPYMGIFAMRYAMALTPEQRRAIRDFYFGGLDQYRMIANCDHNQKLSPPKQSLRSDNVDFQRGELEWGTHNIYFDQYSFKLDFKEVKLNGG